MRDGKYEKVTVTDIDSKSGKSAAAGKVVLAKTRTGLVEVKESNSARQPASSPRLAPIDSPTNSDKRDTLRTVHQGDAEDDPAADPVEREEKAKLEAARRAKREADAVIAQACSLTPSLATQLLTWLCRV